MSDSPRTYGVDLAQEAALLGKYDVVALGQRVRKAVDRRLWLNGAATGALAALAVVGMGAAGARSLTTTNVEPPAAPVSCPVCPASVLAEETACRQAPVDDVDRVVVQAAKGAAALAPSTAASARAPASCASTSRVSSTPSASPVGSSTAAVDDAPPRGSVEAGAAARPTMAGAVPEEEAGSRLKKELALFDMASRALAAGDQQTAVAAGQMLRARYPGGPLAIEAGLVVARALRDEGKRAEARAVVDELRHDPRGRQKADDIAALDASLAPPEDDGPSRVVSP